MGNSFPAGAFGTGNRAEGMWQMMEQLRSGFEKRSGTRVGRGDVRASVLALLAEQPMHGYQIIREIEERSGGSWKPSAGSSTQRCSCSLMRDSSALRSRTAARPIHSPRRVAR